MQAARDLIRRNIQDSSADGSLQKVIAGWDNRLSVVTVQTPDPALDLLVNRWLLYQVQSCRVWGRSAFYQSGAHTVFATSFRM